MSKYNVQLYDEVPFTKDYNNDRLTDRETTSVLDALQQEERLAKDMAVDSIFYSIFMIIMVLLIGYSLIFAIDWHEELFAQSAHKLHSAGRILLYLIAYGNVMYQTVKSAVHWKTYKRYPISFLTAKGTVIELKEEKQKPDLCHPDGIKYLMTIAVSDTEKISDFDVTFKQAAIHDGSMTVGDPIVIILYPSKSGGEMGLFRFNYIHKAWYDIGVRPPRTRREINKENREYRQKVRCLVKEEKKKEKLRRQYSRE